MEGARTRRPSADPWRPAGVLAARLLLAVVLVATMLPPDPPDSLSPDADPATPPMTFAAEHGAGELDPTFDDDGIAITEISSFVEVRDMDVQVVDGSEHLLVLEGFEGSVWRLRPDGTIDTTFGNGGVLSPDLDIEPDLGFEARRLATAPDGGFVVGGVPTNEFGAPVDDGVRIARFHADGTPDEAFDGGVAAVVTGTEPGTGACDGVPQDRRFTDFSDLAVQSDGSVVVVGPAVVASAFPESCETVDDPGVGAVRLGPDGTLAGPFRGLDLCAGATVLAEPRSVTIGPDDDVAVSVAVQCLGGIDPVTVARFDAPLEPTTDHQLTPEQPTAGEPLPIVVQGDGTATVAARTETGTDPEAWNLFRWGTQDGDEDGLIDLVDDAATSVTFPVEVETATVADMTLRDDGSVVVIGTLQMRSGEPDRLGIATFGPDGSPVGATSIAHPGPPSTSVGAVSVAGLTDGTFRVGGVAEPSVFGLDNHRQVALARLDGAASFDAGFGTSGTGFATHTGRYGDIGEAVTVLDDRRVLAAGRIPVTGASASDPPTGFVLRHLQDGALDPEFAPDDLAGIEIARYVEPTSVVAAGAEVAAAPQLPNTPTLLAQAGGTATVGTEQELRDSFEDPEVARITLTADIALSCSGSFEGIVRDAAQDIVVDGAGHTISQTCEGERILTSLDAGTITLEHVTLSGGNTVSEPGGAIRAGGGVTVIASTFVDNVSGDGGGAVSAVGPVRVSDSFLGRNEATGSGGGGAIATDSDVTVVRSVVSGNTGEMGGAIVADGSVAVTDALFVDNDADLDGGAILAAVNVTVTRSTFSGNEAGLVSAGSGGAVRATTVDVSASTFDDNSAVDDGGAVAATTVTVANTTLDANAAGLTGGAISATGQLTATYTTIADNAGSAQVSVDSLVSRASVVADPDGGENCAVTGTTDSRHSADTAASCGFSDDTDLSNTFASLGPLADNGGPTSTRAPGPSGALVNAIPGGGCDDIGVAIDQRGQDRPQGWRCDIGAVEQFGPPIDISVEGLAVDAEGRPVIAGFSSEFEWMQGAIQRLRPDGGADPTFHGGRPVSSRDLFDGLEAEVVFHDVTVDAAGRIVAVGEVRDFYGSQGIVVRLEPDGTPDATFGSGPEPGVVHVTPFVESFEGNRVTASVQAVTIDAADRIVVTGWGTSEAVPTRQDLFVGRLLDDGTRDADFGDGTIGPGIVLAAYQAFSPDIEVPSRHLLGRDVAVRDERIIVAGTAESLSGVTTQHGFVSQFTASGSHDPGFGTDEDLVGFTDAFPGVDQSVANGIAIDPAGNLLVAGGSGGASETVLLGRLLATGAHDPGFGEGGVEASTEIPGAARANDVAMAPDGRIVVTGRVQDDRGTRALVARYHPGDVVLDCVPEPLDLGGVALGEANAATITCTAAGSPQVITAVSVAPGTSNAGEFTLGTDTCTGVTLVDGDACQVTVTFSPDVVGERTATLALDRTTVTGDAVTALGVLGRGTGEPGFSATPNPVVFPAQIVGTTGPTRTLTVTNLGDQPMTISATTLVGAHTDDFALVTNTCLRTLGQDETCSIRLGFAPGQGPAPSVVRTTQLQFTDTAPGSPHLVSLRGSAQAPTLELDPTEGQIETEVEATGTGFVPGTSVDLRIADLPVGSVDGSEVTEDGFTTTFEIPGGTPGGAQVVVACQGCDATDELAASTLFEVVPRLFVQPTLSRPGGVVTANGDGFPAGAPVRLDWEPGIGTTVVTADDLGEITTPLLVFRRDRMGNRDLEARLSGSDEVVATVPFLAVPGSSQPQDFSVRR